MENMERFTPPYTPSHTPSWTVWRIYALITEDHFHVLVFNTRVILENISSRVPIRYRNTRSPYGFVFPLQYLVLPNFHLCFYNCMATRKMFSIYVKYVKCWHYSLLSLSNVVNLLCLTPLILLNQSVEILGSFHFRISLSRLERGSWNFNISI